MSKKIKNLKDEDFNDNVIRGIDLADNLIARLIKNEATAQKILKDYANTDYDKPEECVEDYVLNIHKQICYDNANLVNLCKLLSIDFEKDLDDNLTINNLFTLCGRGTKYTHIKLALFDMNVNHYLFYDIVSSKYFIRIKLIYGEDNYVPNDIPIEVEISLSHDSAYAIVKAEFLDNGYYQRYYFYTNARNNYSIYYNGIGPESIIHKQALHTFTEILFKGLQTKWIRFSEDGVPVIETEFDKIAFRRDSHFVVRKD